MIACECVCVCVCVSVYVCVCVCVCLIVKSRVWSEGKVKGKDEGRDSLIIKVRIRTDNKTPK